MAWTATHGTSWRTHQDYNDMFGTASTPPPTGSAYYKDLSLRLKNREIDIVIVVNMFLTGFDATTLNTRWTEPACPRAVQAFTHQPDPELGQDVATSSASATSRTRPTSAGPVRQPGRQGSCRCRTSTTTSTPRRSPSCSTASGR